MGWAVARALPSLPAEWNSSLNLPAVHILPLQTARMSKVVQDRFPKLNTVPSALLAGLSPSPWALWSHGTGQWLLFAVAASILETSVPSVCLVPGMAWQHQPHADRSMLAAPCRPLCADASMQAAPCWPVCPGTRRRDGWLMKCKGCTPSHVIRQGPWQRTPSRVSIKQPRAFPSPPAGRWSCTAAGREGWALSKSVLSCCCFFPKDPSLQKSIAKLPTQEKY